MATHGKTSPSSPSTDSVKREVQHQLSLVASFDHVLATMTAAAPAGSFLDVLSRVQQQLTKYKAWLESAGETQHERGHDVDATSWVMEIRRQAIDGSITVIGPGSSEPISIPAELMDAGHRMRNLNYIIEACSSFSKAQMALSELIHAVKEIEEESSRLTQDPDLTVKTYIRNLKEYNEVKDIGQQLIGLIAENRGVPVRTLYESGEFGVGMPQ